MSYIFILAMYCIPTIVAFARKHKDAPAIAAVNVFLGWTVIGWFMSLIWSLADPNGRGGNQTVIVNAAQHNAASHPAADGARLAAFDTANATGSVDQGAAHWDSMSDKNDADQLEEYLIRFPEGAFAQLARKKLDRQGLLASASPQEGLLSSSTDAIEQA
jgi:hypothetical protein